MITSRSNPRVKWVHALQIKRHARREESAFVIEGVRLAREAVAAGAPTRLILCTDHLDERGRGLVNSLARLGGEVETVTEGVMTACSSTETPPGLLAVLAMPNLPLPDPLNLAVVADGLADPGNLGTLLRTALAAGVQAVFVTPTTVDPYNPKVVRGAMGAHLHLPIIEATNETLASSLAGLDVWVAEARLGKAYNEIDWRRPSAIVIGGEAAGPSTALRQVAKGQVHIPMAGRSESLNAAIAAAVILFEIARQRGQA